MKMTQASDGTNNLKTTGTLRFLAAVGLSLAMTGCGQLGQLLSNDKVIDADNDQVVFVGDSIFALSGEIQNQLEEKPSAAIRYPVPS